MNIRLLLLTTQTPHHVHFVRQLVERGCDVTVIQEQVDSRRPQLPFMKDQIDFETDLWFSGGMPDFADLVPTERVDEVTAKCLAGSVCRWDVAISFGSRILRPEVLCELPENRWNLHGGDPQRYRGLDSHLWATYHRDRTALVTTLHSLTREVDSGPIVAGTCLDLMQAPRLDMLRAVNTEAAIQLVVGALAALEVTGQVPMMPQVQSGRYYSALPPALMADVQARYARFIEGR